MFEGAVVTCQLYFAGVGVILLDELLQQGVGLGSGSFDLEVSAKKLEYVAVLVEVQVFLHLYAWEVFALTLRLILNFSFKLLHVDGYGNVFSSILLEVLV